MLASICYLDIVIKIILEEESFCWKGIQVHFYRDKELKYLFHVLVIVWMAVQEGEPKLLPCLTETVLVDEETTLTVGMIHSPAHREEVLVKGLI